MYVAEDAHTWLLVLCFAVQGPELGRASWSSWRVYEEMMVPMTTPTLTGEFQGAKSVDIGVVLGV